MICFTHRKECEELEADERNMDTKIKKKQEELDRTEKRLKSLENVRPQFMDEVMIILICFILFRFYDIVLCYPGPPNWLTSMVYQLGVPAWVDSVIHSL